MRFSMRAMRCLVGSSMIVGGMLGASLFVGKTASAQPLTRPVVAIVASLALDVTLTQKVDIHGPIGSHSFGSFLKILPNGNFVVVDTLADPQSAGAMYLYRNDGTLISTLRGRPNDYVGSGGIVVLDDGNFVASSPCWRDEGDTLTGAATWVNATTGLNGTVSSANSLVGTRANGACAIPNPLADNVYPLGGGNYVVLSPRWSDNAETGKGAITWGRAGVGVSGAISASNSLVGLRSDVGASADGDALGDRGLVRLTNGNAVVSSAQWNSPTAAHAGAATFIDKDTGIVGNVSAANSLVGSTDSDFVAIGGAIALANGNYVVVSPNWNRGTAAQAGAVTWGDGHSGIQGPVSIANSLVGNVGDILGFTGVTALSNGNYVVASGSWDSDTASNVGATTWASGARGLTGEVSASNSLVGSVTNDGVGLGPVIALSNGNYVVTNATWSNGNVGFVGAVTWADGARGITGKISTENSLVGTDAEEQLFRVVALDNGNYVVSVPNYDDNRGAVQWVDGRVGLRGEFTAEHAIVGSVQNDQVGEIVPLPDGNYLVWSPFWSNGIHGGVGAVTWADGTRETATQVSAENSLVGTQPGDHIGYCEPSYTCKHIAPLSDGSYLVFSPDWDNGTTVNAGAVTWLRGHGTTSSTISPQNSLTGSEENEGTLLPFPRVYSDGTYIFASGWGEGVNSDRGAVTVECAGVPLPPDSSNSIIDQSAEHWFWLTFDYDPMQHLLIVGQPAGNLVTLAHVAAAFEPGHSGHARPPAAITPHR